MKNSNHKPFQIKSKKDAEFLLKEIKRRNCPFSYYIPLMGLSGGAKTISREPGKRKFTITSSGSGWQSVEGTVISNILDFIWNERKLINVELRDPQSEWYMLNTDN